jgi:hypothetical protein
MRHGRKWPMKFPLIFQYANAREEFSVETEEYVTWALELVRQAGWVLQDAYTATRIWKELRAFLEAIISGQRSPAQRDAIISSIFSFSPSLTRARIVLGEKDIQSDPTAAPISRSS